MTHSVRTLVLGLSITCGCTTGGVDVEAPDASLWSAWGGPACAGHTIDGRFGGLDDGECREWNVEPIRGRFGDLYLDVDWGSDLVVLNDWHLRDDAPAEDEMFNLFCLATELGLFEIRVFGDQHVEAWLDAEPIESIEGASGFGPSPLTERDHSMFEFRLARLPTTVTLLAKDPAGGRRETPALRPDVQLASSGTCFPGSAPEVAHNLVEEPTIFRFDLGPDGVRRAGATSHPALFGIGARVVETGDELTVHGHNLGEGATVLFADTPAETRLVGDEAVVAVVPDVVGIVSVRVRLDGAISNALSVEVHEAGCVPRCGECGPDGCGGTCGACVGGFLCNEVARACVPEDLM